MDDQNNIDWCNFFSTIERNPSAITPRLTVRQFIQAREHLYGCDTCFNRVERVMTKMPKVQFPEQGTN
jgi:hypothetical protein